MSTVASLSQFLLVPFVIGILATGYWFAVVAAERFGAGLGNDGPQLDTLE